MELRAGHGLGEFVLGSTLANTIDLIRSRYADTKSTFGWDESNPSQSTIYLTVLHPPLQLLFSPEQRLIRIQLARSPPTRDVGELVLYRGKRLKSKEGESILTMLRKTIGPTQSAPNAIPRSTQRTGGSQVLGMGDDFGEEILCYPGVSFGGVGLEDHSDSNILRIMITPPTSSTTEEPWLHPSIPETLSSSLESVYEGDVRLVSIQMDRYHRPISVALEFHAIQNPDILKLVIGQTTREDITAILGAEVRLFWKEDDRMLIHSPLTNHRAQEDLNAYFMFYPHIALTLLLHSINHTLLKIILHSNLPGEVGFGRTSKAPWVINTSDGESRRNNQSFARIKEILQGSDDKEQRAMTLDRGVEGGEGLKGDRSLTEIHGYPGIAFEVTRLGDVETVWLF